MNEAKPFFPWMGGKTRLLPQIEKLHPKNIEQISQYIEPFLGGAASLFRVRHLYPHIKCRVSDVNKDLILCYQKVKESPDKVIEKLFEYIDEYRIAETPDKKKEMFIRYRNRYNSEMHIIPRNPYDRVALFIMLTMQCYNSIFRVNSSGKMNTSWAGEDGKKNSMNKDIMRENILTASENLQDVEIECCSYTGIAPHVTSDTFVYFDPPYKEERREIVAHNYTSKTFGDEEQAKLARFFSLLDREKRAKLMLSNSDAKDGFFDRLYSDYTIHRLNIARLISCKAETRRETTEILVTNY